MSERREEVGQGRRGKEGVFTFCSWLQHLNLRIGA
jgi:hypothetical protein